MSDVINRYSMACVLTLVFVWFYGDMPKDQFVVLVFPPFACFGLGCLFKYGMK